MTHPLDGLLAFLGALAFIGAIIGIPISMAFEWSMNVTDKSFDKIAHKSTYPITATVSIITAVLFVIVIALAFINQALP